MAKRLSYTRKLVEINEGDQEVPETDVKIIDIRHGIFKYLKNSLGHRIRFPSSVNHNLRESSTRENPTFDEACPWNSTEPPKEKVEKVVVGILKKPSIECEAELSIPGGEGEKDGVPSKKRRVSFEFENESFPTLTMNCLPTIEDSEPVTPTEDEPQNLPLEFQFCWNDPQIEPFEKKEQLDSEGCYSIWDSHLDFLGYKLGRFY